MVQGKLPELACDSGILDALSYCKHCIVQSQPWPFMRARDSKIRITLTHKRGHMDHIVHPCQVVLMIQHERFDLELGQYRVTQRIRIQSVIQVGIPATRINDPLTAEGEKFQRHRGIRRHAIDEPITACVGAIRRVSRERDSRILMRPSITRSNG